ncbi:MAG: hypothetical protein N2037_07150 [Acidimicrobiales bacterium]|nr:hypothetical protein [Acidimicrobiales bacterium]
MHPIERLRYVARASGAPQSVLVEETAAALASFVDDPQALVTACRRVVARQPASGPLLWLAARVLTAGDPRSEVWEASGRIHSDATSCMLAGHLPDDATVTVLGWPEEIGAALARRGDLRVLVIDVLGEGNGLVSRLVQSDVDACEVPNSGLGCAVVASDLVLLETNAAGPSEFLAVAGSRAAAAVARHARVPVWLVAGEGRLLPEPMWTAVRERVAPEAPWLGEQEVVPLELVDQVIGPVGAESVAEAFARCDCPVVPELFKGGVF